ncbi:MAG: NADH-quinone oxidoreductase subunit L [Phycisphaerae bacterium]|nr:NADH-quinone oxidoreductase subunit L [Phycisphaerae bacterium]
MNAWEVIRDPLMLPVVVPAIAGLVAYIAARPAPIVSRLISPLAAAAALGWAIRLFLHPPAEPLDVPFLQVSDFTVAMVLSASTLGALIALGAAFFGLLVALYAQAAERGDREEGRFHAFLCWTLTGAIGAALADDLVWLLFCWEIVSLCLYMLLTLGRGDAPAGAAKTFAMIGFGDAAMLLAIALLIATEGTTRISSLAIEVGTPLTYACYLMFMAAAMAKAGAVPLHSWIPTAAASARASVFALLPASIDKLLGIGLLARFSLDVFTLDAAMRSLLMVIGGVTIIAAVLMAMVQHHLKTLLAYHAVSQVGYMVLGIGTGTPIGIVGGLFHMVNHAIYKSCLFFTAGAVEDHAGTDDLNRLGGLVRTLPLTFACCMVSALAISGVPPLNGFVSKWLVYQGCLGEGSTLATFGLVVAVFGSALTLASFFKVIASVYWGSATRREAGGVPVRHGEPVARILPMIVLAVLCVAFGVVAAWPLQHLIVPAATGLGVPVDTLAWQYGDIRAAELGLWSPVPATMLILLGLLGGLGLYIIGRASTARLTNTFVGGEKMENDPRVHFPATSFYRTVEELPGLGAALRDGGHGAFDVYRLGGRCGGAFVEVLRRQHTGVLSLYVSWCLVGVVVIAVYLMAVL